MDGDGSPDHVLRRSTVGQRSGGSMFVKHNRVNGTENLLKTIHRPLGSRIDLEYQRTPNTFDKPQNRIVLSKVTVDDGHDFGAREADFATPNLTSSFSYANGFYDRNEKEFFGFGTITTQRPDGVVLTETYENRDYHLRGSLIRSEVKESVNGPSISLLENTFGQEPIFTAPRTGNDASCVKNRHPLLSQESCDVVFPFVRKSVSTYFENGETKAQEDQYSANSFNFDAFGNLKSSFTTQDDSTEEDNLSTHITYQNITDKWILGLPLTVEVKSFVDETLRREVADYDELNGNLLSLSTQIDEGGALATTSFAYDTIGNLTRVDLPNNEAHSINGYSCSSGEHSFIKYTYDTETRQFVTEVEDAFGLKSSATYDKARGLTLTTTNANQQITTNTYDDFGRIKTVRGPYDAGNALSYSYFPDELPARSVAIHTVATNPNYPTAALTQQTNSSFVVTTFVDGFGRPLQVQVPAVVQNTSGNGTTPGVIVQKPPQYDNLGRVTKSYFPFFSVFANSSAMVGIPTQAQEPLENETTSFAYDDKRDRVTSATLPDGSIFSVAYSIATAPNNTKQLKVLTTDALDRQSASFTDGVGRTIAVIEPNDAGLANGAKTQYTYLPTGEVATIKDNRNNTTSMTYDMRGLTLSVNNPDAGLVKYNYDKLGNVVRVEEPNHRAPTGNGQGIVYAYDKNRLSCVDYPTKTDVIYQYGEVPPGGGTAQQILDNGRLTFVSDETGFQTMSYGKLGELLKIRRSITAAQANGESRATQEMSMDYDTFGRLLRMKYPDGESVRYFYNTAGQLRRIAGRYGSNPFANENATNTKDYIKEARYDKFGNKTFVRYGNDVVTRFSFEPKRVRLQEALTTANNGLGNKLRHMRVSVQRGKREGRGEPLRWAS